MRFSQNELSHATAQLLSRAGEAPDEAAIVADILVWCDKVGRSTQGLWRLEVLCNRLEAGGIRSPSEIQIEHVSPACLLVDGADASGHYICHMATRAGISSASATGCAAIAIRNSNYCGALGYYAWQAAEAGFVSLLWSNAFAKVASFLGTKPVLGTNPMAFGAPVRGGNPIVADFSTSSIAGSAARLAEQEGTPLDPGVARAQSGQPLSDASQLSKGYLLPFGGAKGYALALTCEILCGVLATREASQAVRSMYGDPSRPGKNGQFMVILDPSAFVSDRDYNSRLGALIEELTVDNGSTRLPGDARWEMLRESEINGVPLSKHTVIELNRLCERFGVPAPEPLRR